MDSCSDHGSVRCTARQPDNRCIISCYIPSRFNTEEQFRPVQIITLIMGSLCGPASLLLCIVHYIYIFRQLRIIRKVHNSNGMMPPVLNRIEIPIQWESEVRALKSLATVFFMAVVPYLYILCSSRINCFNSTKEVFRRGFSSVFIFRFSFYFLPTSGPIGNICSKQKIQSEDKGTLHMATESGQCYHP